MIRLRAFKDADTTRLCEIKEQASWSNEADRPTLERLGAKAFEVEPSSKLVAEVTGSLVGYIAWQTNADGTIEIDGLFVVPEAMGQGVGRALLGAVQDAHPGRTLTLWANANRLGFYQKLGFQHRPAAPGPGPRLELPPSP